MQRWGLAAVCSRQLEWPLAQERRRGGDYTALIAENHLTRQIYCEPFLHQEELSLERNFSVRLQVGLTVGLPLALHMRGSDMGTRTVTSSVPLRMARDYLSQVLYCA